MSRIHGHSKGSNWKSPTYHSWQAMRSRCHYHKNKQYSDYGGRGIRVCAEWDSFESFLRDVGERPQGMTLDRIDNDGHYELGNCRWATRKQQQRNSRRTKYLVFQDQKRPLKEWAEILGLHPEAIRMRLRKGLSIDQALATSALQKQLQPASTTPLN